MRVVIKYLFVSNFSSTNYEQEFRRYQNNHNERGTAGAVANMINSVAFLGGNSTSNNTLVKQAQTQTERKLSCLKQFIYCLLANQVSEKN